MKCICPGCGRKVGNGELSFDFTEFIGNEIKAILKNLKVNGESTLNDAVNGCEAFFNHSKENIPFLYSETELYNMPKIIDDVANELTSDNTKFIEFKLPCEQIVKILNEIKQKGTVDKNKIESFEDFKVSLTDNLSVIESKLYKLKLMRVGDGDVKVTRVSNMKTIGRRPIFDLISEERLCPYCSSLVSYWAGRYEEISLTVLGGQRISKTTTLTACADRFINNANGRIQWEGSESDKAFVDFKNDCLTPYANGEKVKATNTDSSIPRVSFKVTVGDRCFCLTFVDLPGELNGPDGISEQFANDYPFFAKNIDFVWYCTANTEVEELVGEAAMKSGGFDEEKDMVSVGRLIINMDSHSSYFNAKQRELPVVYVLGKSDVTSKRDQATYRLFSKEQTDSEKLFLKDIEYNLEMDLAKFDEISRYMQSYVVAKNRRLLNNFIEKFPHHCFIPTSAYGYNPQERFEIKEHKIKELCRQKGIKKADADIITKVESEVAEMFTKKAYNVELPFYWMLALKGYIKVKFNVANIGRNPSVIEESDYIQNLKTRSLGRQGIFGRLVEIDFKKQAYEKLYTEKDPGLGV